MSLIRWEGLKAGGPPPLRPWTPASSQPPSSPTEDWDQRRPAPNVLSGQISVPKLADLLEGLCEGGGWGGEGDFPFSEQLDYPVRGSGKNSLLKPRLLLHSPACALALSLRVLSRDLWEPGLACF